MPFVLMPGAWKKISGRRNPGLLRERAHGDGVFINVDSPEAFEEIFWRIFCGNDYIQKDRLLPTKISKSTLEKFRRFVHNALTSATLHEQDRYLSKNNNNVLRLGYIKKAFPQSHIVISLREPLQHATSLLQQHLRFTAIQTADKFALDYMNWLGHFEFGLNQKCFFFGDESNFFEMMAHPKNSINFWLLNWKNYYRYILEQDSMDLILFDYDKFCSDPARSLTCLFECLSIPSSPVVKQFNSMEKLAGGYSNDLLDDCLAIYKVLRAKSIC
jgi:hypothetical protein